jgi:hypothetical protein
MLNAAEEVLKVIADAGGLGIAPIQFVVNGAQFFIRRLNLFFRRLQFFVGALQFLIAGEDFFIGGPQVLIGKFPLLNDGLQVRAGSFEVLLESA